LNRHLQSALKATALRPQSAALVDFHEKSFEPPNVKVSLGKLEAWVKDQVKHGDYNDCSEVVRDAVRKLKQTVQEPAHLQDAMDRAEKSGFKSFDPSDWEALRKL
jgi:putative addiction module CopG family antidote